MESILPQQFLRAIYTPTFEERVEDHMQEGTYTLYCCPHPWALRHRFINKETGEMIRVRCNLWTCEYCGPRKVQEWLQIIEQAQPILHVVLTRAGTTVEEASRALTTWVQAIRRGSPGRGALKRGARPAYPIEYLAVLERHKDFEHVGFHWHLLIVGVDFLPRQEASACWRSATRGKVKKGEKPEEETFVTHVGAVRKARTVGYVTKYLVKDITREERGTKHKKREVVTGEQDPDLSKVDEQGRPYLYHPRLDEQGKPVRKKQVVEVEQVSKARRIRYSRGFFPESVQAIRSRLFSREEQAGETAVDEGAAPDGDLPGNSEEWMVEQVPAEPKQPAVSGWQLYEADPFTHDIAEYQRRIRQALEEAIRERMATGRQHSRRVLTIWHYQRERLRFAG